MGLDSDIWNCMPPSTSPAICALLHKYMGMFSTPSGLPPSRTCNHKIPLMPDSSPVKVKPYGYPHSQKAEIENMVQQMLVDGLIGHSTSPFSSPVVLI